MLKLTLDLLDETLFITFLETIDNISIKGPRLAQNKEGSKYTILTLNTNSKETQIMLPTDDIRVGREVIKDLMSIFEQVFSDSESSYIEYRGRWVDLTIIMPIVYNRALSIVNPDAALPKPEDDEKYKAMLAKLYKNK